MARSKGRQKEAVELDELKLRLEGWRQKFGGPGRRLPEELWAMAAQVAHEDGIEETARALRLDPERLGARVAASGAHEAAVVDFVELDAGEIGAAVRTTVEVVKPSGDRLHIALGGSPDLASLVRAFLEAR